MSMQWPDLFSTLIRQDGLLTLDEHLAHAVALSLSDTQQIQRQTDGRWSKFEKTTRYNRIITVMKQIGQHAHFSEIAILYNQIYPDYPLSEHNIYSVISERREFVRVGRGKYGLAEWGMHNDGNVSNAVRRILAAQKLPMHLTDITDEVLKLGMFKNQLLFQLLIMTSDFQKQKMGKSG